jgi:hypothetical protein
MDRFKQTERLAAATRGEIPKVAVRWLAAARDPLERLTMAALDPDLTDEAFLALVEKFSNSLPGLLDTMDHAALANLMEEGMGAGMANGIASRSVGVSPTVKAKLPWETDAWLAGRYDESKHKRDKRGKFSAKEGREWQPADAAESGVLSRISGRPFKAGARILAKPDDIRHAVKGHAHQLQEKDWNQLRGRLFDPRTDRKLTESKRDGVAVQFNFSRGTDRMEAVFTLHFPNRKSPGELHLKTYKSLDPRDIARK